MLKLNFNQLTTLPVWIGTLTGLTDLDLDSQRGGVGLTTLPASITALVGLPTSSKGPAGYRAQAKLRIAGLVRPQSAVVEKWIENREYSFPEDGAW